MILAGVDEAGYGPTLGPLVVAAAAFRVPDGEGPEPPDLWKLLRRSTTRKPDGRRIPVNDSKKLYQSRKGLRNLEEGGLAFLLHRDGDVPADFRSLVRRLSGNPAGDRYLELYPWYRGQNLALPTATYPNHLRLSTQRLAKNLEEAQVHFLGARAVPTEVLEFNESLDRMQNKARVSFASVGSLLKRLWRTFPTERIEVLVDRQGGRTFYGPLLYQKVRPRGLRILEETETNSSYELLRDGPPMRVAFAVECEERCLPVALASMFCKYLRELHMTVFNGFWARHVESLRLTAGYHEDAQRFLADIAPARARLGIDDAALIRRR